MNLTLMNRKNERFCNWWEPHATSTPLKSTSGQIVVNKTQLLLLKTNYVNFPNKLDTALKTSSNHTNKHVEVTSPVIKKTKKKRSTYFDLSSSEEDLSDAEGPVIKLSSKKKRNKELESGDVIFKKISTRKKLEKSATKKNDINISKSSLTGNLKSNEKQVKDTNFKGPIKSKVCCENTSADQSKENIILKKSKKRKCVIENIKLQANSEENLENIVESNDNFKYTSDVNKTEGKPLPIKAEEKQKKVFKTIKDNLSQNIPDLKSTVEKVHSVNLSQCQKKKSKKIHSNSNSVNKIPRKGNSKNFKCANKQVVHSESLQISQNKSDLSHQLFSETIEQEYIKILDLTADEDKKASQTTCFLGKEKDCQSFIWPYNLSHKVCIDSKNKKEKPKIKNQISENQNVKLSPVNIEPKKTQNQNIFRLGNFLSPAESNSQQIISADLGRCKKGSTKNKCKKKNIELSKQKSSNEIKTSVNNISNGVDNAEIDNREVPVEVLNCLDPSREIKIDPHSELLHKKNNKFSENATITNSSKKSVFKQLDELQFEENESGHSVVECWNINNVKCGVFKLKVKAQLTCKTLHNNSHLGGVLLKGNLKIRIGVEEQDLKEGDMAFVPPLTEWQATNNGESESVFYYWCGRF